VSLGRSILLVLTLFVFVLAASAYFLEPPPVWVPVVLSAIYAATLLAGTLNMQLQMFGPALCRVEEARHEIALTFDDGPDPVSTPIVLAILEKAGVKANFFVIGHKVDEHPQIVRDIVNAGHSLGVHSYTHPWLYALLPPSEVMRDIYRCQDATERAAGVRPIWFRPPIGQLSPRTAKGIDSARAEAVGFSVRTRDGSLRATPEACLKRVKRGLHPGVIVLLHDAWERRNLSDERSESESESDPNWGMSQAPVGVRILEDILRECEARHLRPVTLEELVLTSESEDRAQSRLR
jgi:peptidoglycan/xylan/chitin deacetylase (PgdA/CDA1 family)